jgi:hypothetical protein
MPWVAESLQVSGDEDPLTATVSRPTKHERVTLQPVSELWLLGPEGQATPIVVKFASPSKQPMAA